MDEISFIESMQVLEVRDGDILILKVPQTLTQDIIQTLTRRVKEIVDSDKFKIMILDGGTNIGVLRKEGK